MTTLRSKKQRYPVIWIISHTFLQRVTIHNSSTDTSETLNAYVWSAGVCSAFFGTCLFRRSCSACGKSDQSTGVTSSNSSTGSQLSARPKTPAWPVLWYSEPKELPVAEWVRLSYFSTSSQRSGLSSPLATINSADIALTARMLLEKTTPLAFNDLFMSTPVKHRESAVLNRARSTHETVALIGYDTPPPRPLRMMPCRTPLTALSMPLLASHFHQCKACNVCLVCMQNNFLKDERAYTEKLDGLFKK